MTQNPKLLALGLAGGYLLGRTRKAKFALAVASYVLGRRKGLNPQHLLTEGLRKLNDSPEFARLNEQLRGELMSAGRSMVTSAANRRLDSLADVLRDRTEALAPKDEDEEPQEGPEEPDEETDEEPEPEPEPEPEEEPEPEPEPAGGKAPPKRTAAKKAPPKKAAAKKAPAKKAAPQQSGARKTASSKTAATKSTARGTAAKKSASRSTGRR